MQMTSRSALPESIADTSSSHSAAAPATEALAGRAVSRDTLITSASSSRENSEARKALLWKKGSTLSSSYSCAFSRSVLHPSTDSLAAQQHMRHQMVLLQNRGGRAPVMLQTAGVHCNATGSPDGQIQGGPGGDSAAPLLEAQVLAHHALQQGHEQLVKVGRLLDVLG